MKTFAFVLALALCAGADAARPHVAFRAASAAEPQDLPVPFAVAGAVARPSPFAEARTCRRAEAPDDLSVASVPAVAAAGCVPQAVSVVRAYEPACPCGDLLVAATPATAPSLARRVETFHAATAREPADFSAVFAGRCFLSGPWSAFRRLRAARVRGDFEEAARTEELLDELVCEALSLEGEEGS